MQPTEVNRRKTRITQVLPPAPSIVGAPPAPPYPTPSWPPPGAGLGWAVGTTLLLLGCVLGLVAGFLLGSLPGRLASGSPLTLARPAPTPTVLFATLADTPTALAQGTPLPTRTQTPDASGQAAGLTATGTRVYGPISGQLAQHGDGYVAIHGADVYLRDFTAEAQFANPYDPGAFGWDYGFIFAHTSHDHECRLYVTSDGDWSVKLLAFAKPPDQPTPAPATPALVPRAAFKPLGGGVVAALNLETGATNRLRLAVKDSVGTFFVNDSYVGTFPLPTDLAPGDVQLGSAFLLDNNRPDTQVVYTDFSVWSLESP